MSVSKEISANISKKAYAKAEKIILYLDNPDDPSVILTATEKKTLDYCKEIHGYRLRSWTNGRIIALLKYSRGLKESQVRNLIRETEKIFGTVEKVHKEYERNFLLEMSRQNLKNLMEQGKDVTKALVAHYRMAGLEEFIPDMPDFENLEQHKYIINLPVSTLEAFKTILQMGAIKLTDIIPASKIDTSGTEEAQEVK